MPAGGYYFDTIIRQPPIEEAMLDPADNLEEFGPISDADLAHFRDEAERLYTTTDRAILANFGGTAFGDIALVPAPFMKHPKGIRDVEQWYMSTVIRRDYVYKVFEMQCEIGLANLAKIHEVVGDRVSAVMVTGTDFGTQKGPFISTKAYRDLYKPFHKAVNDWIHSHTTWKTFIHSCGSVVALIPDFIEANFDILNPVQVSATGMEASGLKERFGDRVTFWGGGVDTQHTLPLARRTRCVARCRNGWRSSPSAAATSSTPFTTSSLGRRLRTSWRCTRRCARSGTEAMTVELARLGAVIHQRTAAPATSATARPPCESSISTWAAAHPVR